MTIKEKTDLVWDGELIKQSVTVEDEKISPKDMLDGLDMIRNNIKQMEEQQIQTKQQSEALDKNLKSAKAFEAERNPFEDKCIEFQLDKLKLYIRQLSEECKKEAEKLTKETIDKDPNAHTDQQKANMHYVHYQRLLATNKKIGKNIAKGLITKHLFEKPIFDNPFK